MRADGCRVVRVVQHVEGVQLWRDAFLACQSEQWAKQGGSVSPHDEVTGYPVNGCVTNAFGTGFKRVNGVVYAMVYSSYLGLNSGWKQNSAYIFNNYYYYAMQYSGNIYGFYSPSDSKWYCFSYVP